MITHSLLRRPDHHSLALHAPDLAIGQDVGPPDCLPAGLPSAGELPALQRPEQLLRAADAVAMIFRGALANCARSGPGGADVSNGKWHALFEVFYCSILGGCRLIIGLSKFRYPVVNLASYPIAFVVIFERLDPDYGAVGCKVRFGKLMLSVELHY